MSGVNRRNQRYTLPGVLLLLIALSLLAWFANPAAPAVIPDGSLHLYMIDVGQGDALLLTQDDGALLIDAGPREAAQTVVDTLEKLGVAKLDILIGTHPHEDHIGGMAAVMDAFEIGVLLLPRAQANTRTFENMLDAMDRNGLKAKAPVPGDVYEWGQARLTVLAPAPDSQENTNNASVAVRVEYGRTAFVLTGDAEARSESEMLSGGRTLKADVLKIGHHGSGTSSTAAFLDAVSPGVALISCGQNNAYGHPHPETLDKLSARGIAVHRTDTEGTVEVVSDGERVIVRGSGR